MKNVISPAENIVKLEREREKEDEVEGEREKEDEVEGEREKEDEVEGEREGQQKHDSDRIQGQGNQGQEEVGEHHSGEDMEEGEHHQDEEGESEREDNMQGSDSERERRVPESSPTIPSRAGPQGGFNIFKSGDKLDPNNYRGICISSNLGKVLCSILNTRLTDYLTEHNVLSRAQIGFLPHHRTSDHIFTLHILIDKHLTQHNDTIFTCFVDFQKAFDSIWHNGLFNKLIESGVGGKMFDVIKSMYSHSKCAVKIGTLRTGFFPQSRGVRQGCSLSPTLFNSYINELAEKLHQCEDIPGLSLGDTKVTCLLYADDLVLLSPTREGLQQSFEGNQIFTINNTQIQQATSYTYLGTPISSTGSLGLAVKELREKARRALFTIKKSIQFDIPITICLKLFKSVIEPIALYSSEVWGPLTQNDFTSWDRHPTEALHTEFCRNILHVQRKVPNTACRAELGQYPLLLNIPRRALNFWKHIKSSDPQSLHYRALASQELNTESSPLSQLVLKLSDLKPNDITNSKHPHHTLTQKIKTSQIITHQKHNYTNYWTQTTQHQHKLQVYSALNRDYTLAPYLPTIRDQTLRRVMTRSLFDHIGVYLWRKRSHGQRPATHELIHSTTEAP
ncbi:hypothetical protein NFI96_006215, partial [Prochilodus magdalenae]